MFDQIESARWRQKLNHQRAFFAVPGVTVDAIKASISTFFVAAIYPDPTQNSGLKDFLADQVPSRESRSEYKKRKLSARCHQQSISQRLKMQ